MKKYVAIGHWVDSKNTTCAAMKCYTMKHFRENLGCNGFIPYVIISEKKMEVFRNTDEFEVFDEVKKMTGNYRKWLEISDYIKQCFDIMEDEMANAK